MTNEEKAIETYRTRYLKGEERERMRERRMGFVAGANWKDQQFKEYLEKCLATNEEYPLALNYAGRKHLLEKIINELFKEN